MARIMACETLQTTSNSFIYVPSGLLMPSRTVVVRIQATTYDILCFVMAILAQVKVCRAFLMEQGREVREMEAP